MVKRIEAVYRVEMTWTTPNVHKYDMKDHIEHASYSNPSTA